jgi:hypothetical protein
MTAVDAIARAGRSTEIYALLNVYSEAIHLAEHIGAETRYPLENAGDAMEQMQTLFIALGLASRRLEDESRNVIKEALFVFNAALERLRSFPEATAERTLRQEHIVEKKGGTMVGEAFIPLSVSQFSQTIQNIQ